MCRIIRVIGQPRGNMLLVGIGGSGRQSLAKLASYTLEYKVFMIEVTKHYRRQEFHEGLLLFHSPVFVVERLTEYYKAQIILPSATAV